MTDSERPTRREFVRTAAMSLAGCAVCACGSAGDGPTTPPPALPAGVTRSGSTLTVDVSVHSQLRTAGGLLVVNADGVNVMAVGLGNDQIRAYSSRCPHAGTTTLWESLGSQVRCNAHGSTFTLQGGLVFGPATAGLVALASAYDISAQRLAITLS